MSNKRSIINIFHNLKLQKKIPNNFLLIGEMMLLQKIVPHLAQIIVCPQNTNCASGCVFCQNIKQNSYEDFFLLRPEKNIIKISDLDTLFD